MLKFLHRLDYTNPKHYKVCVGTLHSLLLDEKAEYCPVCVKDRLLCIIMSSDCIFTTGFVQMNAVNSCYVIGEIRMNGSILVSQQNSQNCGMENGFVIIFGIHRLRHYYLKNNPTVNA